MFILEALLKADQKRVLKLAKDALFGHDIFLLPLFDDVLLLEDLHGVDMAIYLAAN